VLVTPQERHMQAALEQELQLRGWRYFHASDARRSVPGFPDIIAVRGTRLFVAEIKTAKGRVSTEQRAWLDAFTLAGVPAYLWRLPADWAEVGKVLA
jgi:Holliday junction resolvase